MKLLHGLRDFVRDKLKSALVFRLSHDPTDTDVLRSHVYNLRKVLDHPFEFAMIQTVKGVGLRLINNEG